MIKRGNEGEQSAAQIMEDIHNAVKKASQGRNESPLSIALDMYFGGHPVFEDAKKKLQEMGYSGDYVDNILQGAIADVDVPKVDKTRRADNGKPVHTKGEEGRQLHTQGGIFWSLRNRMDNRVGGMPTKRVQAATPHQRAPRVEE